MHIRQLQVGYAPEHDRLLIRINSSDGQEVRCWLTRRLAKQLLPGISNMMQNLLAGDRPLGQAAREALLNMNREVALEEVDYGQQFMEDASELPLGADPLLITQIELHPLVDAGMPDIILRLFTSTGQGFELRMAEQLQHAFYDLLQKAIDQSDWGLDAPEEFSFNFMPTNSTPTIN